MGYNHALGVSRSGYYDWARPDVREDAKVLGNLISEFNFNQPPRPPVILDPFYLKFIEDDFLHDQRLNPATDGRPDSSVDRFVGAGSACRVSA